MPLPLWVLGAGLTALLLGFSQTHAFHGDEGFHLLAARLVNLGKRPYVDFFYQHAPLWIYVMGAWMRVFGETWRSVHALSALLTGACITLVARYVYSRGQESPWRLATAAAAAVFMGLSVLVIWNGTVALAHGLTLLLSFVAFLLVVHTVSSPRWYQPLLAGLCAGAAAAAWLLTAPVSLILLLWLWRHTDREHRFKVGAFFLLGTLLPFVPLLWLAAQAPRAAVFDIVEYQLLYRATWMGRAKILSWNLRAWFSWLSSVQALLLILLSVITLTVRSGSNGDQRLRRELGLCAWLAAGLSLFLLAPQPTSPVYFVAVVPFMSILAGCGLLVLGSRLWPSVRPWNVLLPIALLFSLGLARPVYLLNIYAWPLLEDLGREVARVTPEHGLVYASESILFTAKRLPAPGVENFLGLMLPLPPERLARLKIMPPSQVERWLADGRFHTVMIGTGDPRLEKLGLLQRYAHHRELYGFYLLSDPR